MQDDPLPQFDLFSFTPYRLALAADRLSEELSRHYRDRFGISIPEWRVLVHLSQSDDVSVRDIETRVAMEKSKVSRAATRLETRGLIEKAVNEGDRRLVRLRLSAQGRAMMAELLPVAQAYQNAVETRLGAAFADLENGLSALLDDDPTSTPK